ncbi:MAG: ribonuclease R [Epulopiscium sp. Nuni2H_MBin001]|nr:MAG: ribonuclease R [Epulopiscium sp. Nuni2H_MBin001]
MILNNKRKETIMKLVSDPMYTPMRIKELATVLQVPANERLTLEQLLKELIDEGKLMCTKRGKYKALSSADMVVGIFSGHSKGFGFVTAEDGAQDIFIPADSVNGALHKDKVLCKLIKKARPDKRCEGKIIDILERGATTIVGTYEESKQFGFVVPDEKKIGHDIYIPKKMKFGAVSGHKVLVELTEWKDKTKNPEGKVVAILGHINDPGVDILSICYQLELPMEFPKQVIAEVAAVDDTVADKDKRGRMDLRDIVMVTIDGEDAKDLDDAVSLEILPDGNYRLGVHIADVTHYVKEKSPLDLEAYERGTSVYLADRVIPMLPHKLSNGLCSLNAGVDRLALSCIMDIDTSGNVYNHKIVESVILIEERMSYTNVKKILEDKDEELMERYKQLVPMFLDMEKLAAILRGKRQRRGAIDFDFPETKVILDAQGHPVELKPYDRNVATKLIEEFMLICNETVAQDYFWQEKPFVYRTHENPDPERIMSLLDVLTSFGHTLKTGQKVHPKELQKLLETIKDTPEESIISQLMLRSMKQARYSEECIGHFGLSAKYYCHFTSPIRRYPDLQIHRIIKMNLKGKLVGKKEAELFERLPQIAKQCSLRERRAEEAERETIKLKKIEYMEDKLGQEFEGVINGVTSWGIYVELPNTVEGLVHVTSLTDDYYVYEEDKFRFVGERYGKVYQLGDVVKVRMTALSKANRTIDFTIIAGDKL